ncbi:MAG: hypothetical protein R3C52_14250 [Hyphomonadaceae bacterium]
MRNEDVEQGIAWITRVRRMHRNKRLTALLGCVLAILLLLWGRFSPGAPQWAIPAGVALAVGCWVVLAWVVYARYRWAKANPYTPGEPSRER